MCALKVEEITSTSELELIEPEWSDLHQRCPDATPFHSPAWLIPWWKHFGFGELWTLAVREWNQLVALAPLFIHPLSPGAREISPPGSRHSRQLSPVGIGITDYTDFLFQPEYAAPAAGTILKHLANAKGHWETADLDGLRQSSALLKTAIPCAISARKIRGPVCPFLKLPESPEQLIENLSPNRRHSYRSALRKLQQSGARFKMAKAQTCREVLQSLFCLHETEWREQGGSSVFAGAKARSFHLETAGAFARRGWLRLHVLRIRRQIAAVLYGFSCNSHLCFYQSGFDPTVKNLSPGSALIGYAIQQAIRDGLKGIDFLRGDESYKYTWGAINRQCYRLLLKPP